ncbi:hypothetical protein CLU81_5002 [Flavobacterium sp. 9]|nr:hypothetical protein CLU81_5002 [Flavobacterium sp. 9]
MVISSSKFVNLKKSNSEVNLIGIFLWSKSGFQQKDLQFISRLDNIKSLPMIQINIIS